MVMLRPFRALRYDPERVGDLSAVVAPPYDVISDAYRDALYARSDWNVIRLILNRAPERYTAAAEALAQWRRDGVVVREPASALCYYSENFSLHDGSRHERSGVIGVVRLEPFATGHIRPHERTFAGPKEDRMRLLRACRTNLSPIFGLCPDHDAAFARAQAAIAGLAPDIDLHDDAGSRHRLWFIRDAAAIATVTTLLAPATVIIADGHHRYETALAYRDHVRHEGATDRDAPANFVLMYLTRMRGSGLVILPTHRVLKNIGGLTPSDVIARLQSHFCLTAYAGSQRAAFRAHLHASPDGFGLGLAGCDDVYVVTPQSADALGLQVQSAPAVLRRLDVTLVDVVALHGVLAVDVAAAAQSGQLTYTHDDDDALDAVEQGATAAFLLNPPTLDDLLAVCRAGETMPQKSTYFYPKLLTGLVFNPLDER